MADPNRKINLNANDSSDEELNAEQTKLVKDFESEFENRYTDSDPSFMEFCALPKKPIPIVDHWHSNNNNRRGGRGNYHHRGGNRGYYNRGENRGYSGHQGGGGYHHNQKQYPH